jgi:hypothetical protein
VGEFEKTLPIGILFLLPKTFCTEVRGAAMKEDKDVMSLPEEKSDFQIKAERFDAAARAMGTLPKKRRPTFKMERAAARKAMGKDGAPPEKIELITEDRTDSRGKLYKCVRVHWNYGRRLSMSEVFILSYHRMNEIIADREGLVFGFNGREID